ncbi:hypothetical protein DAETH_42200 (plasmid) [Deinococcus aetherius]|uniref:histidine kinase n=1 Tax=Deinococcus aetherius TaxID=200252 RepID=A0ABN6RLS4_9DEIO|nr:GAF domain-containing protein [Deinococcus aetherius]BDP44251.1 hypothetical protein DAETH_42200 [Deinococcus aetherius]
MSSPATSPASLSQRLQDLTEALAAAGTRDDVFRVVLHPALEALSAVAGAVLLVSAAGDRLEIAAVQGHEEGAQTLWQDGPLDGNVPTGDALRRREPLFFEHEGDLLRAYPELEARTGGVAAVATAVLPMFLDEAPLGVIVLDFQEPHGFTGEEKRFLRTLASQCALALGRIRLLVDLRGSEARFRRMVEASPVAIAAGDLSGRLILVNDAYLGLLGLTRAEFEAGEIDWASLTPPEYREADGQAFAQALGEGTSEPYEKEMLTRGGERVPLNVVLVRYEDVGQSLVVGYLGDLRTRRAAEAASRARGADLEAQVRERTRESEMARVRAEVLAALGDALQRASTPEQVSDLALATLGPALRAQSMLVVRVDGQGIRLPTLWGQTPEVITSYMTRPGLRLEDTPILHRAAEAGRGVYLNDYHAEPGTLASFPSLAGGVEPIHLPDGTLEGFLVVWRGTDLGPWQDSERDLLFRAAGTLGLAFERARAAAQLAHRARQIEEKAHAQEAFVTFTEAVGTSTDVVTLAGRAVEVLKAQFVDGTGGYYQREDKVWKLRTWTTDLDAQPDFIAARQAGLPGDTPLIAQLLRERAPIFTKGWDAEPEGIEGRDHDGTVAAYPVMVAGEVLGFLMMGFKTTSRWAERDQVIFRAVGRSLELALERAEQARQLQARKDEEARRSQALSAFAELSRDLVLETDPYTLIRRTQEVVLGLLPPGFSSYFEPDGDRWRPRSQVGHANTPELQAVLAAGLPFETTPNLLIPWRGGEAHYQDEYDPASDHLVGSEEYPGATVTLPVQVGGEVRGVLGFALFTVRRWSGEDRAALETVGRQLTLALERAEQTRRLAEQNAELEARTRALEGFSDLLGDLTLQTEPSALIGSALEMVMTLLPPGYAAFWEVRDGRWYATAQARNVGSPALQATIDAGLPAGQTPTLDIPQRTRAPYFQDVYAQGADTPAEVVSHVNAVATLPVMVRGEVLGIFNVPLFHERRWSAEDRAVLETTVRSLGLALERAEGVADLSRRTEELRRSNAELEQFAYIASHDLQAPIRAVTSFAGVIHRKYGQHLDERGQLYLRQIMESGEHMKRLVDDLLAFSRVHTQQREPQPVDSGAVFDVVARRLQAEPGNTDAEITRGHLPLVLADGQQLDQLLQNLISNGLKYHREGVVPRVRVSAEQDGEFWRFAVSDNGIGIEPQYYERIFTIFQRLHGREEYEGTGIGLAVCKKIVERHGGRLWLESTLGEGTTFFFTLPEG